MWLKAGNALVEGTYAVYPLSPKIIMYCFHRDHWGVINKFDCCLSPVALTDELVADENTGQAFAATRFVLSPNPDFGMIREFAATIGTDKYAPKS